MDEVKGSSGEMQSPGFPKRRSMVTFVEAKLNVASRSAR
jgi:hypothetical protein